MIDDLDRIMAVMEAAFDPAYGEAWTRSQVSDALLLGQCHYLLIDAEGQVPAEGQPAAGFALLRRAFDEEELLLFAVVPQWRRRGLGARLLLAVLAKARAGGVSRVLLEMRRGNPAEALYRLHGFELIGIRPQYYRATNNSRIDALTFACPIQ
ncbi:MAG: GNAT family N-acetyltransferase [Proteobacteria bacterium]|nr:GNAT family N-acetyltransferase [Pseudomonadota bacterium]